MKWWLELILIMIVCNFLNLVYFGIGTFMFIGYIIIKTSNYFKNKKKNG